MFEIFDKVFVVSLDHSSDRKKFIEEEFARVGIRDYEFFKATEKDSEEVTKLMASDFVVKFPPCFRCKKNECNCPNNLLIKQQIGNWCSFINVLKEIIKHRYRLCLVCEDDLKFTDKYKEVLTPLLNENNFQKHNIDHTKPLLIRISSKYCNLHEDDGEPRFTKDITWSNSCFAINYHMAVSLLNNLKKIDHTSDVYIHRDVLQFDNNIQHFTIIPQPAFDLSSGQYPESYSEKFYSEIHPKRIDNYDVKRDGHHIKRIEYKKLLCYGHPRCGTKYASAFLTKLGLKVGHESMDEDGVSSWMLAVDDENYPWGEIKNRNRYYFENTIHVIRNPFEAIPSIILENQYSMGNKSYTFRRKYIEQKLGVKLPVEQNDLQSQVQIAVQTFIYWNRIIENQQPHLVFRIEHDQEHLVNYLLSKKLLDGFVMPEDPHEKVNSNKLFEGKQYDKPIVSESNYFQLPTYLKKELIEFCEKYNYCYFFSGDYKRVVIVNDYDFCIYVPNIMTDRIFMNLIETKVWQKDLTKIISEKIKTDKIDAFIDVGANIGYFALLAGSRGVENIYAFEPFPKNYDLLLQNILLNEYNINTYKIGLSDEKTFLDFFYRDDKSGHGSLVDSVKNIHYLDKKQTIEVDLLDNIPIQGTAIGVKIDVEGNEYKVLLGMKKLLDTGRVKFITMELSPFFVGVDECFQIVNYLKNYFKKIFVIELQKYLHEIDIEVYIESINVEAIKQCNIICINE